MASPPLGLLYLSSALRREGYDEIGLLHGALMEERELEREVEEAAADVVIISAITAEGLSMAGSAWAAKRANRGALVICGGHHPTADPEFCLLHAPVDLVVRGEGELTVPAVVRAYERGEELSNVEGISFKEEDGIRHTPPRPFVEDLDRLPHPDWDLLDLDAYQRHIPQTPLLLGSRYMSVVTSRGCPYDCSFCHKLMGQAFRAHSPERVVAELGELHRTHGIDRFEIADDLFNFDRPRALRICELIASELPGLRLYMCGIRSDLLDRELLTAMRRAGVVYMATGLETGDPAQQDLLGKRIDLERFAENVALAGELGIFTTGGVILGFPGEGLGDMARTVSFAARTRLHTAMMATLRIYPGTGLAQAPGAEVLAPETDDDLYAGFKGMSNCSDLPDWQLTLAKLLANLYFYSAPLRLWRILRDLPERRPEVLAFLLRNLLTRTVLPR